MHVVVDLERCESNGVCVMMAPDVFDFGPDDRPVLLTDLLEPSAIPGLEAAVAGCPRLALTLVEP